MSISSNNSYTSILYYVSGFTTAITVILFINNIKKLTNSDTDINKTTVIEYPSNIKDELYSRVASFFGENNFDKVRKSYVVVIGLGGVGSHVTNMLVRNGINKIKLIDFDYITLSSLNRSSIANLKHVGNSKANVLREYLLSVCPWCDITAITEIFQGSNANILLNDSPDYVIDCIDDINTKVDLIEYCCNNNLKLITCMGAGGKSDPTKIRIAPLVNCVNDPLATKIKYFLRKKSINYDKIISVFSIEKSNVQLLPLNEDQANNPNQYGILDSFRIRIMPVLGTSPSIFGQAMASYVLCELAGMLYEPEGFDLLSKKLKHKMRQMFRTHELRQYHNDLEEDLHDDDIEFLIQSVWKSRCAISNKRFFGPTTLILTRWDKNQPPKLHNLVLVTNQLADRLVKEGNDFVDSEKRDTIEKRLIWTKNILESQIRMKYDQIKYYANNKNNEIISSYQSNMSYLVAFSFIGLSIGISTIVIRNQT